MKAQYARRAFLEQEGLPLSGARFGWPIGIGGRAGLRLSRTLR